MSFEKNQKHLGWWCSVPLVIGFVLEIAGILFPAHSKIQNIFFQIVLILETTGYACLAVKTAMEHWHIPAAGFTILAIATGIFFSQIKLDATINYEEGVSGVLFIIPAMALVCYYAVFPWWLRIMGLVSTLPFIYLLYEIYKGKYTPNSIIEDAAFIIFELTTLGWAWYTFKDERRRIDRGHKKMR
jgi:hypothetical protein